MNDSRNTSPRAADPKALYQEVILDHNRKPRNYGTLADASHHADGHNPLCGDQITMALRLDDGKVGAIAFEGESIAKMYIGNWSDYETMMMEKFGKDLQPHRVKYRTLKR
jgi:hypothetical protein